MFKDRVSTLRLQWKILLVSLQVRPMRVFYDKEKIINTLRYILKKLRSYFVATFVIFMPNKDTCLNPHMMLHQ